jgi:hypothetical protein
MASMFRSFWPDVFDVKSAKSAAKQGWQAAFVVSSLTAVISLIAAVRGSFLGYDAWSFIDSVFTAIIGWRIMRMSRVWAFVGLTYWILNVAARAINPTGTFSAVSIVTIIILFAFINGVRGTFACHRCRTSAQPR